MQEIIKIFENKINDLELSIKSSYEFARVPGCEITYSGYEMIHRKKERLEWYKNELEKLKNYSQCKCTWFYKILRCFNKNKIERYGNRTVYQCKKCNKYFFKYFFK